jgi:glycosyltransferase involved in cell wall biosynthesis
MKLLHLCSDYPYTDIYRELLTLIGQRGYRQIVYIPVKSHLEPTNRAYVPPANSEIVVSRSFRNVDRLFYFHKVHKLLSDLSARVDLNQPVFVHAHYLFSMGGIAFELKKRWGIDYVVSVRNTDVNLFFKYGYWLRHHAIKILKEARNVVFISPSYRTRVLQDFVPVRIRESIADKSLVVPNGVNSYWLANINHQTRTLANREIRLIFVGALNRNKNIKTAIKVTVELARRGYNASLKIAGKGPYERDIMRAADRSRGRIIFCGYVTDKSALMELFRRSDIYMMPSIAETFGLAYVEAMTQGLPIIYSHNEGVDGYFPQGSVGFAVDPYNVGQIADRVEDIRFDYDRMSERSQIESRQFSWDIISGDYVHKLLLPVQSI